MVFYRFTLSTRNIWLIPVFSFTGYYHLFAFFTAIWYNSGTTNFGRSQQMPSEKFTQRFINSLPETDTLTVYFDTDLTGFGIYTKGKTKTYFVKSRVGKKQIKITIGRASLFTLAEARVEAKAKLSQMASGIDPVAVKRAEEVAETTLEKAMEKYLETRSLKPGTVLTYNKLFRLYMSDWLKKPISSITKEMIAQRHKRVSTNNGSAPANNLMRTFRAVYNFARSLSDGAIPENPVSRLTETRQWNKVDRRRTFLKSHELQHWYNAATKIQNFMIRDYLLLILFTGLREKEGLNLTWEHVDMQDRSFTVAKELTKNGRPHTLPMSNFIYNIFERLHKLKTNGYVFPGSGKEGHLVESAKQIQFITAQTLYALNGVTCKEDLEKKIQDDPEYEVIPGISFCLHDLRRTFVTVAESLDISYAALKKLLNHADGNDVTGGYLQITTDRLRDPMERISSKLMELMGIPVPEPAEEVTNNNA